MAFDALTHRQQAQPCWLLNLPVELVMIIIDHLKDDESPEYIASLALTCKVLFAMGKDIFTVKGDTVNLPPKNYVRLQMLVQRDYDGKMVYCSGCRRLRPSDHPLSCGALSHRFTPQLSKPASQFFLVHACVVLERHHLGAGHGLPQHILEQPSVVEWGSTPFLWEQKPSVKIIKDEMYMCVEHVFEGDQDTFDDLVRSQSYWLRRHIDLVHFHAMMSARANLIWPLGDCGPDETWNGRCSCCDSNFTMKVQPCPSASPLGPPRKHSKVTITAYHNLGFCRRPDEMPLHVLLLEGRPSVRPGGPLSLRLIWNLECERLQQLRLRRKLAEKARKRRFRRRMMKAATKGVSWPRG